MEAERLAVATLVLHQPKRDQPVHESSERGVLDLLLNEAALVQGLECPALSALAVLSTKQIGNKALYATAQLIPGRRIGPALAVGPTIGHQRKQVVDEPL